MLHDLLAVIGVLFCLWAIVNPRVPTGIVGTGALGAIAVACLWSMDDNHDPWIAIDMLLLSGMALGVFIARRGLSTRNAHMRRRDDWNEGWRAPYKIEPSQPQDGEASHG